MDFSSFETQLKPVLLEAGYHLLELKFGGDSVIRAIVHKEPAFTHKDCAAVAGLIHEWAEIVEGGSVFGENMLEVSSPGLTRTLRDTAEAAVFPGRSVKVTLRKELDGSKEVAGDIIAGTDEDILLKTDSGEIRIPSDSIRRIKLSV